MHLKTLKERRERRDLLQIKICLTDIKKYSFSQRSIDTWNELKEKIIKTKIVQQLKKNLDKYRYGDVTTRMALYTTTR